MLPPSRGKPGIKLNKAKAKLMEARSWTMAAAGPVRPAPMPIAVNKPDKNKLTNGPAIATQNASAGVFDSLSKLASPPNRNREIDFTPIPCLMATQLCPNSWAKTEANNSRAANNPSSQGATGPNVGNRPASAPPYCQVTKPRTKNQDALT